MYVETRIQSVAVLAEWYNWIHIYFIPGYCHVLCTCNG